MQRFLHFLILFIIPGILIAAPSPEESPKRIITNDIPGFQRLPPKFTVYVKNNIASNKQTPGSFVATLSVNNDVMTNPGCYITCYRFDKGAYSVGNNVYAVGLSRVWGIYSLETQQCNPKGTHGKDIANIKKYQDICNQQFTACESNQCWAKGDTGKFFHFNKMKFTQIKDGKRVNPEKTPVTKRVPTPAEPTQTSLFDPTVDQTPS